MSFASGQRWHSLTEPELGLGHVDAVEGRQVVISFPAREVVRRYSMEDPPLVRARLAPGQHARGGPDVDFCIEEVLEQDGLLTYVGQGQRLSEAQLDAELDVATPENRLLGAQVDDHPLFDLRSKALQLRHQLLSSPARGFLGGRIQLFDHQLSIARDVCERHQVRVLLADEVGLGKTIEALLILHRMLLSGRIENALILVPPALVHQWLAEAYLRFNLILQVMGEDTYEGGTIDLESEDLPEQLLNSQLFVCPLGVQMGHAFGETSWDLVIVDEAHHLQSGGDEFSLVEDLAARTEHVILLSATPDRDGEEGHFRRLALLDPARFHDQDTYQQEAVHYRELASTATRLQQAADLEEDDYALLTDRLGPKAVEALQADPGSRRRQLDLLSALLDLHGIGRIMYRNVRARIPGFPTRRSCPEIVPGDVRRMRAEFLAEIGSEGGRPLTDADNDPRVGWLTRFLVEHPEEKLLALCASQTKAEAIAEALATPQRKVACFHEGMGTVSRDRQAAWFLDEDGPQVVVCSAIGAEGRNFQVARHLVLLDLPLEADRLEQAIGRIDRIGQGKAIFLHTLVIEGSPQHRLLRWHDEGLRIFETPWHGSPAIEREFQEDLIASLLSEEEGEFDALLDRGRRRNEQIVAELDDGRDRLLELTSFDIAATRELHTSIKAAEKATELEAFMVEAFERGGLDVERIGHRSYAMRAGMDYHRPFPGFHGEQMGVTFDRQIALRHPERVLLTWDHPMVRDTVDTLLGHEHGNASVARVSGDKPGLCLEALFVAEPTVSRQWRADRFLPPTPIRVVIDVSGHVADFDIEPGDLEPADPGILQMPQVSELVPRLLDSARERAEEQTEPIVDAASDRMRRELEPAVERLAALAKVNPSVSSQEVQAAHEQLRELSEGLAGVRVRLDALRLLVVGPG
ncbi:MAG: RNA polymerase-associated protein RapA [Candidatus Latescibacterota bacterium]|nr:RNA polymerase-associated protein RapA [Candidatus Latescibacterota bacterium]